jgi:trehalose-6-phosphate synthase
MGPDERRERMHALFRKVATHDIRWWTTRFIEAIDAAAATSDDASAPIPALQS